LFHVAKLETTAKLTDAVLKGQDIVLLLKLARDDGDWTMRSLGEALDLDPASVHRALRRLDEARLIDIKRRRVNRGRAEEFLLHGFQYVFPVHQKGTSRGLPTAWAAPPLSDELALPDDPPPVWPDAKGKTRGVAVEPIHASVPALARRDPEMGERLALLDGIRLGDARVRKLASQHLVRRLDAGN
ncbi:MAG TPA: hypothetical protein VF517_17995, partial [Thermoleophilaceae bacterium]|jgi:DNA-binding transcriptional ArsR family regulator